MKSQPHVGHYCLNRESLFVDTGIVYEFYCDKESTQAHRHNSAFLHEHHEPELSTIRKNIETAVEEVILIAAKMLRERIPDIVRASKDERAHRKLSEITITGGEVCPSVSSSSSSSSSLNIHTFSLADSQSSHVLPEIQRPPASASQLPIDIQSYSNSVTLADGLGVLTQQSGQLEPARSMLEGISPMNLSTTNNSNLRTELDFLNEVDWESLDESFINFDWQNLSDAAY